jgi:DNA replication and repair protein RecF
MTKLSFLRDLEERAWRESNPRPLEPESNALSTELHAPMQLLLYPAGDESEGLDQKFKGWFRTLGRQSRPNLAQARPIRDYQRPIPGSPVSYALANRGIGPMFLRSLHLQQFRNYAEQSVTFGASKTILVGDNAQGKSNLLEAVEILSTLKSHRTSRDRDLVQDGATLGQIRAEIDRGQAHDLGPIVLGMTLRSSGRRTLQLNGETLRRQLDAIGLLNTVQFSSLDLDLVRGSPAQRRDWLDRLLTQLEPYYAHLLSQYNRVLRQRNSLLKSGAADPAATATVPSSLALWDSQLVALGTRLMRRRARAIERLRPIAQSWHERISGSQEALQIRYSPNVAYAETRLPELNLLDANLPEANLNLAEPNLAEPNLAEPNLDESPQDADSTANSRALPDPITDPAADSVADSAAIQSAFFEKLQQRAIAEHYQATSLVGPHRDEIELSINDTPARQYGSQGQQRTLVLALKLAELNLIDSVVGDPPILLLDDVLAELDLHRQGQLLEAIHDRFQTLITTTHLNAFDNQWIDRSEILTVQSGKLCQ